MVSDAHDHAVFVVIFGWISCELPLEVGPPGTGLADRLDCNRIPSGLIFCNPGSSVCALTSLPQEGEAFIETCLVVSLSKNET